MKARTNLALAALVAALCVLSLQSCTGGFEDPGLADGMRNGVNKDKGDGDTAAGGSSGGGQIYGLQFGYTTGKYGFSGTGFKIIFNSKIDCSDLVAVLNCFAVTVEGETLGITPNNAGIMREIDINRNCWSFVMQSSNTFAVGQKYKVKVVYTANDGNPLYYGKETSTVVKSFTFEGDVEYIQDITLM